MEKLILITFKQVLYFLGVAQAGQVSLAARDLNISQSAVTLALQDLEAELGVKLFERRSTGLRLSQDGQRFMSHARNIQGAVSDAMNSMRTGEIECTGTIQLGMTHMLSGYFLFPILARFRRMYPKITVNLVESDRSRLEEKIKDGSVDLALLLTSNLVDRETIQSLTLLESPRKLWVSSSHRLLSRETVSFEEISKEPYVLLHMDEADESARKYWNKAGLEPNATFVTESVEAVRAMVANGFAVTILSDMVYRPWSLDGGRIETRNIEGDVPSMNMGLAWKRGRDLNQPEQVLRDYIKAQILPDQDVSAVS